MAASDQLPTLLGSASAGMIGRVFCHPIDTIKARLQASASTQTLVSLRQLSTSQLRGLYRGLGVSMIGSAPATCLYLTSYEVSKDFFQFKDSVFTTYPSLLYLGSGMMAETISCVFWVPIDVVKERMQVQQKTSGGVYYRSTYHAFDTIFKNEGLNGLYRGYGATLLSFGPFSALYFLLYEKNKAWLKVYTKQEDLSPTASLVGAATAGAAASFITNPLDLVKLRLQVQRAYTSETAPSAYTGVMNGLLTVVRTEGIRALFKGAGARIAFHTPSTAITMSLFETCRRFFQHQLE